MNLVRSSGSGGLFRYRAARADCVSSGERRDGVRVPRAGASLAPCLIQFGALVILPAPCPAPSSSIATA